MKFLFTVIFSASILLSAAQENVPATDSFSIRGKVKSEFTFNVRDAGQYTAHTLDSLVIYNHLHQPKKTVRKLSGILLKDVLDKAGLAETNTKLMSGYYFTCVASDGYKIVFSWNELYNSPAGSQIWVVTEANGRAGVAMPDRVLLVAAGDINTGRRYLKGLKEIRVNAVN